MSKAKICKNLQISPLLAICMQLLLQIRFYFILHYLDYLDFFICIYYINFILITFLTNLFNVSNQIKQKQTKTWNTCKKNELLYWFAVFLKRNRSCSLKRIKFINPALILNCKCFFIMDHFFKLYLFIFVHIEFLIWTTFSLFFFLYKATLSFPNLIL